MGFKVERATDAAGTPGAWTPIATIPPIDNHYTIPTAASPIRTGWRWPRIGIAFAPLVGRDSQPAWLEA